MMSVMQIIVISVVLFILYKFLLKTIGVEQLGIWSLVLATTSVTQIANFGLSGSVVKFVAKYVAHKDHESVSNVIQTAALSVAVSIGIILLAIYPLIKWILAIVISPESLSFAFEILPFSLLALWILMIANIFNAGLDGSQRIYLRNILLMVGTLFYFFLALMLTSTYGLVGLAYAQVAQNTLIFLCSWILLKRYIKPLPIIPYRWDKNIFKEIIGYGVNFQAISVTTMFYDPITKALLSKFGGLSFVGYYEMASKMVQQFRALIVSANQVLVPAIATIQERIPEKVRDVYLTSYQLLFYLALPLFSFIIVCTPVISELWIGHYQRVFVIFGILLAIGWFLNTLSGPAYFANLGIGELRWNVIGHIAIALLNVGLGFLLGIFFDGIGVVVAWVISLALGSSVIYLSYHIKHRIPLIELLPKASRIIAVACLIGILSAFLINHKYNHIFNTTLINSIILLSFSIIVFILLWVHPMRRRLVGWVSNEILSRGNIVR
jgi:O-antigen/teichoic acid export membrane protein